MSVSSSCDTTESPLEVLSRAATMVEKSPVSQRESHSPPSFASSASHKGCERSPSFKERHPKFRKPPTPDYLIAAARFHRQNSSSSSADQPTASSPTQSMDVDTSSPPPSQEPPASRPIIFTSYDNVKADDDEEEAEEGPIDMSIKKARSDSPPAPPPYRFTRLRTSPPPTQSMPSKLLFPTPPPYVCHSEILPPPPSYEASTQLGLCLSQRAEKDDVDPRPIREITIITDSSADPLLDEHFRRSLGANYKSLFKKNPTQAGEVSSTTSSLQKADPVRSFKEDMDMQGYTVEDHFAKALGDTWRKLQAKTDDSKKSPGNNNKPQVVA